MTDRRPPVEFRSAAVNNVDFAERLIEVMVVPYAPQSATIEYRGEVWTEFFEPGALTGIDSRQRRIPVNLEHDRNQYVGRVESFNPDNPDGALATLKIFDTDRGNEALRIAADDGLSSSIGFGVRGADQVLDRRKMERRIQRAFIDHVALVAQPAYEGAKVLAVRADMEADAREPLKTPLLNEVLADRAWLDYRRNA